MSSPNHALNDFINLVRHLPPDRLDEVLKAGSQLLAEQRRQKARVHQELPALQRETGK